MAVLSLSNLKNDMVLSAKKPVFKSAYLAAMERLCESRRTPYFLNLYPKRLWKSSAAAG